MSAANSWCWVKLSASLLVVDPKLCDEFIVLRIVGNGGRFRLRSQWRSHCNFDSSDIAMRWRSIARLVVKWAFVLNAPTRSGSFVAFPQPDVLAISEFKVGNDPIPKRIGNFVPEAKIYLGHNFLSRTSSSSPTILTHLVIHSICIYLGLRVLLKSRKKL